MDRRSVWSIFNEPPEDNWGGLRGDVYMWNLIRSACWNYETMTIVEFSELASNVYSKATGQELVGEGEDFVQLFSDVSYGMSKGYVSRKWWIDKGLPTLRERLLRFNLRNGNTGSSSDEERAIVKWVVKDVMTRHGIEDFELHDTLTIAPYVYKLLIPHYYSEDGVVGISSEIFHRLGLLPEYENLAIGDKRQYCQIEQYDDYYLVLFNEPSAIRAEYGFQRIILQNYRVGGRLMNDIKSYMRLLTWRKGDSLK